MDPRICEFESPVLAALDKGSLEGSLKQHAEECESCRESVAVWHVLHEQAKEFESEPLPSPGFIWWKSQLQARREHAERSTRPIRVMQIAAILVALIAVFVFAGSSSAVYLGAAIVFLLLVAAGFGIYVSAIRRI